MLWGCDDKELQELHLQRNPALYNLTRQGAGLSVSGGRAPLELRPSPEPWCWQLAASSGPGAMERHSRIAGPCYSRLSEGGVGLGMGRGAEPLISQASDSDERSHHQAVTEAMRVIGFSPEEVGSVYRILAAILHLVRLSCGHGWGSPSHMLYLSVPGEGNWPCSHVAGSFLPLLKPSSS